MDKIRLAHVVVTRDFAGVERYVSYLGPHLVQRGFEVTVFGGDRAEMAEAFAGTGVGHVEVSGIAGAARAVRHMAPDLVHSHMTYADAAAVLATIGQRRVPIVSTLHFARRRGSTSVGRLAAAVVGRRIDRDLAVSQFVARSVGATDVIPHGVPPAPAGPHDERTVLVAQRLESEKATDVALRAWAAAHLRHDGWRLVVAGRGSAETALRRLVDSLGTTDTVDFVGFVRDVPLRLASAAALVAPAPAEPFGLTVAEAMARATPVIAAGGGAHLETAGRVTQRWLFPPGDAAACGRLLDRLAAEPRAAAEHGAALRRIQQEEYSLDGHLDRLVDAYRTAIDTRRGKGGTGAR